MPRILTSESDETERVLRQRNAVCSFNLLVALRINHGDGQAPEVIEPEPQPAPPPEPAPLPPIPNSLMAEAADLAAPPALGNIKRIQLAVCKDYGVTLTDMLSRRRDAKIVRPRQVAMYLAKTLTERSLPEIGRRFGGRDHTTALSGIRKIEGLCSTDAALCDRMTAIAESLGLTLELARPA